MTERRPGLKSIVVHGREFRVVAPLPTWIVALIIVLALTGNPAWAVVGIALYLW